MVSVNFDDASAVTTQLYSGYDEVGIPHSLDSKDWFLQPGETTVASFGDDTSPNDSKKPVSVDFYLGNIHVRKKCDL